LDIKNIQIHSLLKSCKMGNIHCCQVTVFLDDENFHVRHESNTYKHVLIVHGPTVILFKPFHWQILVQLKLKS